MQSLMIHSAIDLRKTPRPLKKLGFIESIEGMKNTSGVPHSGILSNLPEVLSVFERAYVEPKTVLQK